MEENTVHALNHGSRKKKKQAKSKLKTYGEKQPLFEDFEIPCNHRSINSQFKCKSLTVNKIKNNRMLFYVNSSKVSQDIFLSRLISPTEPIRRGKINNNVPLSQNKKNFNRNLSSSYYLFARRGRLVKVCKKLFMKTFSISNKRLQNLNKTLLRGETPREKRGGDRKSACSAKKKESLRKFLNSLPAKESHYNRSKSKRIYLSSDLSVTKLLQYYNTTVTEDLKMKRSMFHRMFFDEFNIGFSSPASDACSVCILWGNKIKNESNSSNKVVLMTEKRVHKLRANAFYQHMRNEVENSLSFCFDLQQVLPLPRTPIQEAFYARQISVYNFCVVNLDSKKPVFYTWDETQAGRGSVQIGSALYNYIKSLTIPPNVNLLRLFCDGCGGQNKNNHVLHMLMFWLYNDSPSNITEINLYFPVRGHSFLPADRVFGRVEKCIRQHTIITKRSEYLDIFKQFGEVKDLGQDWDLFDIKELENSYKRLDNFQRLKRIQIKKRTGNGRTLNCVIKGLENYRFESSSDAYQSLLKRSKRNPTELEKLNIERRALSMNKKKDIENLLIKQFGENWADLQELNWYKNILLNVQTIAVNEKSEECECLEEEIGELRI